MLGRRTGGQADRRTDVTLTPSTARGRGPERRFVANFFGTLRKIAGMPDYAAHVEHLQRCHPEAPMPSEREFYDDFVRSRYGDGPTRCC
jgi:uncharacterized short protein YbdD (DUF466 family)